MLRTGLVGPILFVQNPAHPVMCCVKQLQFTLALNTSEQIGELLPEFDRPKGTLSTLQHGPLTLRCALVFGLAFQPILNTAALGSMMGQDLVYCTNC